ncbi:MAG: hypothetical protein AAF721_26065, partial [Myxococcota bacterium]
LQAALDVLANDAGDKRVALLTSDAYTVVSDCDPLGCTLGCDPDPPEFVHVGRTGIEGQPFTVFGNPQDYDCAFPPPEEGFEVDRVYAHVSAAADPPQAEVEAFATELEANEALYHVACPGCGGTEPTDLEWLAYDHGGLAFPLGEEDIVGTMLAWAGSSRTECFWPLDAPDGYSAEDLTISVELGGDEPTPLERVDGPEDCSPARGAPGDEEPAQWFIATPDDGDDPFVLLCPPACHAARLPPLAALTVAHHFCADR